ncbi:hypothetical protein GCM10027615_65880 [Plantactinospora veratri]
MPEELPAAPHVVEQVQPVLQQQVGQLVQGDVHPLHPGRGGGHHQVVGGVGRDAEPTRSPGRQVERDQVDRTSPVGAEVADERVEVEGVRYPDAACQLLTAPAYLP